MKYGRIIQGAVGEEGRHFRESTLALLNCYACKVGMGGRGGCLEASREEGECHSHQSKVS